MSMTDPISDMLTRIRNAQMVAKKSVTMPASKIKRGLCSVLQKEGYIRSFELIDAKNSETGHQQIKVNLKYFEASISGLEKDYNESAELQLEISKIYADKDLFKQLKFNYRFKFKSIFLFNKYWLAEI